MIGSPRAPLEKKKFGKENVALAFNHKCEQTANQLVVIWIHLMISIFRLA